MHDLKVGDELRLTTPVQNFPLAVGASRYVLVAAGIGVTALAGMAHALRRIGADYTFHYAGRNRSAMAFLEEIETGHGEQAVIATSGTGDRLDVGAIVENVRASEFPESTEVYICGPLRLLDAVQQRWRDAGLPVENLRFETFGSSGRLPNQQFYIRVPSLGLELPVGVDQSLLAALEDAGVEVMSDCRRGECGLCALRVLDVDGQIDHRDVFLSRQQAAQSKLICACVSRGWRAHVSSRAGEHGKDPGRLATVVVDTP
jgi:vanillate O-demethylase ferredoxin subunit